jgi:TRAP-type C4-dicarboxylate transport system substrate-binding protein
MVLNAKIILFTSLLFLLPASSLLANEVYTLKFATLIPVGTSWTKLLDDWIIEVETKSKGRIKFKMYPGGIMGDEPDVIRKMRKDQLQGGLFTGYGIGRIYSPARVLEVPFLFKNTDESDYVRDKLMPEIELGFRKNEFELLGWPEVGFIYFFSKHRVDSLEDVKKRRIWLWQGDPLGEAFFEASGVAPIPLSIIDVYTQLSAKHGSIDTVYASPFGAIALQWHSKLKYGTQIPLTNAIGGLIVSGQFYKKLPADLKHLLKSTGKIVGKNIREQARIENTKSIQILKDGGMEFLWAKEEIEFKKLLELRDKAAKHLEDTNYIPKELFSRVRKLLADVRTEELSGKMKEKLATK